MVGLLDRGNSCKNCGMPIGDAEEAVYDGDDWYCDARCHGQAMSKEGGGVPA